MCIYLCLYKWNIYKLYVKSICLSYIYLNYVYINLYVYLQKCVSVFLCVCEYVCVCVYLHLSRYITFVFNLIKRLHQKPSRGGCSYKLANKAANANLPTPNQIIYFCRDFEISGRNRGVGLTMMICIFRLKSVY